MKPSRRAFVGAGAAAFAVGIVRAPARAAQFDFKCTSTLGADHPAMVRTTEMWGAIDRESGGRLKVRNFPSGILGGDIATLQQLRAGAIEFYIGMANLPSLVPAVGITGVGFSFADEAQALRAMDGALGAYVNKEMQAKGLYILPTVFGNGMRDTTATPHPIRVPDDFNGFKLRTPDSRIVNDMFRTLGAIPTSMPYGELYTSLQTHLLDGQESPLAAIEAAKLYEVQKYLSLTNHMWTGASIVTTLETWGRLPSDIQDIVVRNCAKYGMLERRDVALYTAAIADKFVRRGLAVNAVNPNDFRARLGSYYQQWSKEFGPTAWGLLESAIGRKLA